MRNIIVVTLLLGAVPALAGPFDAPSTLPYQAPRFDLIKDSDYQPAFEAGMKQQLAEIAAMRGQVDQAADRLRQALAIDPYDAEARSLAERLGR